MNQNDSSKSAKAKGRFTLCCFCLGSSGSDPDLSSATFDYSDRCDYVVEKLSIKKVPIALFATEEDLAEMKKVRFKERIQSKESSSEVVPENGSKIVRERIPKTILKENLLQRESILTNYLAMTDHKGFNKEEKERCLESSLKNENKFINDNRLDGLKPILNKNEIIEIDVHNVQVLEETNRCNLSPELEKTLKALGSKRPETLQDIKQMMGMRNVRNSTPNVEIKPKHVTIIENEEIIHPETTQNLPEQINCANNPSTSFQCSTTTVQLEKLLLNSEEIEEDLKQSLKDDSLKKTLKEDFFKTKDSLKSTTEDVKTNTSQVFVNHEGMLIEQDVQTRLTCKELEALINNDRDFNRDVIGVYSNPKWKIIIKEHGKESSSSLSEELATVTMTSDSEVDEEETGSDDDDEESDEEELTTE